MPAVATRTRHRRTINEINMVPFIDVMLVLLIIFMVSAPLITTGLVDLPSVGKGKQQPKSVIEIVVGPGDSQLRLRVDGGEAQGVTLKALAARVKDQQAGRDDVPVVISADKTVRYEAVVKVMDTLQRAGVQRVGLAVKTTGS
ncbi:MAG TPA: ExbD/TolR family protein [Burkholderiaceae bacterium]|jgi:biopolymer transport protein TolR